MGQTDQALAEMQKALALNPRLSEAHYNIARLLIKKEPKKKNDGRGILPECLEIRRRARSGLGQIVEKIACCVIFFCRPSNLNSTTKGKNSRPEFGSTKKEQNTGALHLLFPQKKITDFETRMVVAGFAHG